MNLRQLNTFTFNKVNYKLTWRYVTVFSIVLFILIFLSYAVRTSTQPLPEDHSKLFTADPLANFKVYLNGLHFITIIFLSVFLIINVVRDFEHNVEKKHLADGMSTTECFSSRLILLGALSFGSVLLITLFVIIEGMFFKSNTIDAFFTVALAKAFVFTLLSIFYYLAIALALAYLIRNTAFVLLTMLVVFIAEQILSTYAAPMHISGIVPYLPLTGFYRLADHPSLTAAFYSLLIFNAAIFSGLAAQKHAYAK